MTGTARWFGSRFPTMPEIASQTKITPAYTYPERAPYSTPNWPRFSARRTCSATRAAIAAPASGSGR